MSRTALDRSDIDGLSGLPDLLSFSKIAQGNIVENARRRHTVTLSSPSDFTLGGERLRTAPARDPIRVYGDFLGCVVAPGHHRIALTFAPASARLWLRASLSASR
jgi:hypothetical protein